MKEKNKYTMGYNSSESKLDYLKYGLLNNYGYNFDVNKSYYDEEKIIKVRHN